MRQNYGARSGTLVDRLVHYELPWTGDERYKKAEVTGGGVALDEVDPRRLESRRHRGPFCAASCSMRSVRSVDTTLRGRGRLAGLGAAAAS